MVDGVITLIGAYRRDDDGMPLALLHLAGMPLAEHQARRAALAGAAPILLLVQTVTPELSAMIGRLRDDGIEAEAIGTIGAAAGGGDVLLLADGCLPEPEVIAALLGSPAPQVAGVADAPDRDRYERIDATTRWAGAALITGEMVADTAAMLDDWDPMSTLMRRAVQEGAGRIDVPVAPLMAEHAGDVTGAERAMIVTSRIDHDDWIAARLFTPIEDKALPWLLSHQVEPGLLATGSAVTAVIAGMGAVLGLRWPVLIAMLLVGPAATIARRLARVQSRTGVRDRSLGWARRAGGALALIGLGASLMVDTGQWGWLLVAAIAIAALAGAALDRPTPLPRWHASARTLAWELLPFALFGRWDLGIAVLALHTSLSFAAALATRRADQRLASGG